LAGVNSGVEQTRGHNSIMSGEDRVEERKDQSYDQQKTNFTVTLTWHYFAKHEEKTQII